MTFRFPLDELTGHKIVKNPLFKSYWKTNEPNIGKITFYSEDHRRRVNLNGEA